MAGVTKSDEPIASFDDLLSIFHAAIKPPEAFRCGAEMEKFGVFADGRHVPYEGERGVRALLEDLAGKGWSPEAESPGAPLIALTRAGASITLEPGSQFELSGAPLGDVHEICAELRGHLAEIAPFSARSPEITWLGLGFHPFARREDFTMVPKLRYPIMREYLPTRGSMALDMMLRTATVQANYDFSSEADAMRKLRVGLRLSPLTTAMFANSPFYEGRPFGGKSYRAKVWLDVDNDRSGLVPAVWKEGSTFADYATWALDIPMFMFKRDGAKVANTGQTFRSFWKDGFQGHRATETDWKMHLNTLFPEVRLKNTIEVRGADSQGSALACALPALWMGVYYDEAALAEAEALTADFTHDEVAASRQEVWEKGLGARFRDGTLQPYAEKLLAIAEGGLARRARRSASGKDESIHLARLKELVARGESPADRLLAGLAAAPDPVAAIVERTRLV